MYPMLNPLRRVQNWHDIVKLPFQGTLNLAGRGIFFLLRCKSTRQPPDEIRSILIIRRNRIGDAICTLPWIQAIKEQTPNIIVDILCEEYNSPIFTNSNYIDHVFNIPKSYLGIRFLQSLHPTIRELRKKHYDVAMNAGGFSSRSALLALVARAKYTVGTRSTKGHLFDLVWDNSIKHEDLDDSTHQVMRIAAIGRLTGLPFDSNLPFAFLSKSERTFEDNENGKKSALLCPLVNRSNSRWPDENWTSLSIKLVEQGISINWLSYAPPNAPGELLKVHAKPGIRGLFTTNDLIEIIPKFSIVICSEGGISHLAPALQIPCVALSGANIVKTWRPWSDLCELIEMKDIREISTSMVLNAAILKLE